MSDEFERIERNLVYHGAIIDVYQDSVQIPNGNIAKWDYVHHKGAAAVVPVLDDGRILMVRQYRNALDRYTLEIPAGGLNDVNELAINCAARELEEETGYRSEHLEVLTTIYTTVAFCNERIELFVARDLIQSKQNLDEDEFIDVKAYEVKELIEKILSGELQDSKTVSAILAYQAKYL